MQGGWTPAIYAAFSGHIGVLQALAEAGADLEVPDEVSLRRSLRPSRAGRHPHAPRRRAAADGAHADDLRRPQRPHCRAAPSRGAGL